tara:strand:+ start:4432 stop:5706 length:1275 start_codon:yes stop_codon:yes gene_type:complete
LADKKDYHCSFCGKHKNEISTLIAGPSTFICNECIDLCHSIVYERKNVTKKSKTVNSDIPTPDEINEFLNAHVIGQGEAKEVLSVAVYNHYKRINQSEDDDVELEKSNVMMLGPSGTGKTLLAKTIAKFLDVPFAQVDATTLTESGYVGEDVENVIQRLLMNADFEIKKAEQGIIYIDEIDKKAKKGESISITKDVSGEGVQQALLKIVEGTVVRVPPGGGRKHPGADMLEVNTDNILFIVGGAFVGLDKVIKRRLNSNGSIGFGARVMAQDSSDDMTVSQEVLPEDVIKYGIIPEFMGRFPILVGIDDLTERELSRILTEPKNNLTAQFKKIFKLDGVDLNFTEDAITEISKIAKKNKTGARGLRSVLEKSLLKLQFKLPKLSKNAGLTSVEITGDFINKNADPILVFKDETEENININEKKL